MNGDFNLTRISFPIKCMNPQTMLMTMCGFCGTLPVAMRKAAMTTDPVERMKLAITANFSWFFYYQTFTKPRNPILRETYQAFGQDGTKVFMEQTSHHPPRSHFIAEGPDNSFTMTGYMDYAIYSGMTSTTVTCGGHKKITFADGGVITWN